MNYQKLIEEMGDLDQLGNNIFYSNLDIVKLEDVWRHWFPKPIKLYGVQAIHKCNDSTQYECILLNRIEKDISDYSLDLTLIDKNLEDLMNEDMNTFLDSLSRSHIQIYDVEFVSETCIRFWTPGYWDPSIYEFVLNYDIW